MSHPVTRLIDEWKPRRDLARQIGASEAVVHKWAAHGRIPSAWHEAVVHAAQARGFSYVTAEWMMAVHARPRTAA